MSNSKTHKYNKLFSLAKKTVAITGGLGLIGNEIVNACSELNAHVIVLDINKEKADSIIQKNPNISFELFDITDIPNLQNKIISLYSKYKNIDCWVNSAYPRTPDWGNPIEQISYESWQKNIDMHLNGYCLTSKTICLEMKKRNIEGSIVNIGSIYGVVGNDLSLYEGTDINSPAAYSAIKGGIINFSRYLASQFGIYKIRINTVCPGGVFDSQNPVFVNNYIKRTPLRRMALPEDIAASVVFMLTNGSSYITGQTIMVDGGWTII